MLLFITGMIVVGLIAGYGARAVVPGPDSMGIGVTLVLGIVGSVVGAVAALLVHRAVSGSHRVHG